MNLKEYEEYCEKIREEARKNLNSQKRDATPDTNMDELRKEGIKMYAQMKQLMDAHTQTVHNLRHSEVYADDYKAKLIMQEDEKFNTEKETLRVAFADLVKQAIATKRENISAMCVAPPTQEQLNLLSALQLRGKSITENEFLQLAPKLMTNYNAINALRGLAATCGYTLTLPASHDYEKIMESMDWAENYLNARVNDFAQPWSAMSFDGRAFFGEGWDDVNYREYATNILDSNTQLDIPLPTIEKRKLTENEEQILDSLFYGYSDDMLTEKVKSAVASPEIKTLVELHPKYSTFLKDPDNPNGSPYVVVDSETF